jgi:hypothetical protein
MCRFEVSKLPSRAASTHDRRSGRALRISIGQPSPGKEAADFLPRGKKFFWNYYPNYPRM